MAGPGCGVGRKAQGRSLHEDLVLWAFDQDLDDGRTVLLTR